ncbi:MAG: YggU family protein [Nitrospirae bacterium]|nr:MAG: YggU family protein [Nitrospirota bacterium]
MEIPSKKTKDGIQISVRVEPRSSRRAVSGLRGDALKVKLTAPPVGGAANEQLIEILSEAFGIRRSDISIIRGHSSKNKVVGISGLSSISLKP